MVGERDPPLPRLDPENDPDADMDDGPTPLAPPPEMPPPSPEPVEHWIDEASANRVLELTQALHEAKATLEEAEDARERQRIQLGYVIGELERDLEQMRGELQRVCQARDQALGRSSELAAESVHLKVQIAELKQRLDDARKQCVRLEGELAVARAKPKITG